MIKDLSSNLISASADLLKQGADDKEAYQKFFNGMLKKYGVRSPAELSGDKKKEFYNDIEKGWKHDEAVTESTIPLPGTDDYEDEYGEDITEATWKVQISDWPPIYLDGKSEGAIRAGLRKSLKDPKAIKSIEKVTKSDHKKGVMKRISGKDDEKAAEE